VSSAWWFSVVRSGQGKSGLATRSDVIRCTIVHNRRNQRRVLRRRHPDGLGHGPDGHRGLVAAVDQHPLGRRQDLGPQSGAFPPPGTGPGAGGARHPRCGSSDLRHLLEIPATGGQRYRGGLFPPPLLKDRCDRTAGPVAEASTRSAIVRPIPNSDDPVRQATDRPPTGHRQGWGKAPPWRGRPAQRFTLG
jgi:hypothetical protein